VKTRLKRIGIILFLGLLASFTGLVGFQEFYYRKILDPEFSDLHGRLKFHLKEYLED